MELEEVKKPKIYSIKEVSDFMKISIGTLYKMAKNGTIKSVNAANSGTKKIYGFRAEDVQLYYDKISDSTKGSEILNK